jgi:hypothetical protein
MIAKDIIRGDWYIRMVLGIIASCGIWMCITDFSVVPQAGAAVSAETNSETLRLKKLSIVDSQGRKRIELGVGEKGPIIQFFDERSRPRIEIVLQDRKPSSVPSLSLLDLDGGRTVILQSVPGRRARECSSSLILGGMKGATVTISADKWARLRLLEKRFGGASVEMMCVPQRGGVLSTFDKNEKIRFNLGTNKEGEARLEVFDSEEKAIWKAP